MRRKITTLLLPLLSSIGLSGCGVLIPLTFGTDFDTSAVQSLKKGVTTQPEIARSLRDARLKGSDDKGPFWKYSHQRTMMMQTTAKRLTIWFDGNVVKDFGYQEGPVTASELLGR